jgi:hypothetical protein
MGDVSLSLDAVEDVSENLVTTSSKVKE